MKRGQHKTAHKWRVMGAFGKGSKRRQFAKQDAKEVVVKSVLFQNICGIN